VGQVTVTIADRIYRMACDDGQEPHLERLALELDSRIGQMRSTFGEIGGSRLTVMAAIAALDQREEARERIAALEAEVERLRAQTDHVEAELSRTETEIAVALLHAADRIESVARDLIPTAKL
jgi:cell division protein ZapA